MSTPITVAEFLRFEGEFDRLVGLPVELAVDALYADLGLGEAALVS